MGKEHDALVSFLTTQLVKRSPQDRIEADLGGKKTSFRLTNGDEISPDIINHTKKRVYELHYKGQRKTYAYDLPEGWELVNIYVEDPTSAQTIIVKDTMSDLKVIEWEQIESPRADPLSPKELRKGFRVITSWDPSVQHFPGTSMRRFGNGDKNRAMKFMAGKYNIILMDMQMPIMDGYTATKLIREWEAKKGIKKSQTTPIIALTAYALMEEIQKSLDAGCTAHLTKPIKKAKLLEGIDEYARK